MIEDIRDVQFLTRAVLRQCIKVKEFEDESVLTLHDDGGPEGCKPGVIDRERCVGAKEADEFERKMKVLLEELVKLGKARRGQGSRATGRRL
jgi:hypothetical protein